jgi:DNA-binding NarL/FixJ family response regulator
MNQADDRTTILIVDDHALFREGLREILETQGDLVVVGEAGDSAGAVAQATKHHPHVVLLDVEIPGDDVTVTVGRLRALSPRSQVIILSMYDGPQLLRSLLAEGIRGYLLKSVHWQELVSAIRSARADEGRIHLAVSRESLAQVQGSTTSVLSDREREVLELAAQALSNTQIASRLSLTEATVKRHLRNIFVKLGAVSRIDAVNKATAASIISARPSARPAGASTQGKEKGGRAPRSGAPGRASLP